MPRARIPVDDVERVEVLRSCGLLDGPRSAAFDDLTAIACQLFDVPVALISLVDTDRQWMLSRQGVEIDETPRDVSVCAHAILGSEPLVVHDLREDPRFADNPMVVGGPRIRFYAGTPLVLPSGHRLGTLCVLDYRPRVPDARQIASLEALGRQAVGQIELRRSTNRLRASESRFRSIATTMRIGLFVVGPGDEIWSNPAVTRMLGLEAAQLSRLTFHDPAWSILRADGSEFPRHDMPATKALRTGEPQFGAVMGLSSPWTNGRVWLQVDAVPIRSSTGAVEQAVCTLTEITALKEAKDLARQQTARLQSILTSSPLAIITTDTGGTIQTFNAAAERLLGYAAGELIGRASPGVFHLGAEVESRAEQLTQETGEYIVPGFEVVVHAARRGVAGEREWTFIRKDGTHVPVQLAVTAIRDAAGEVTGFMGVAADITARKHAESALVAAKELAEQMATAKSDFLATMSHEIRTPMNGVLGMTNLLADTVLTSEQRGFVDAIERSAQVLMGVINDILDFSKVEAGKLAIEPIPFDLEVAVTDVAELLVPRAAQKRIELVVAVDADIPKRLIGDAGRIRQVLLNLAGNAVKFTETGHVAIGVRGERSGDDVVVRFEVTDTGIGIEADAISKLFTPFVQADASTTRRFGGTGLGLSISKRIVELMGGRIGAASIPGVGSRFWFDLPLPVDAHATVPPPRLNAPPETRILVVDDVALSVQMMVAVLARRGLRVDAAMDGEQGLQMLRHAVAAGDPYRVAVVDYRMPVKDGEAVAREVRADPQLRDMSLIIATSSASRGDAARFHAAGFNAYLTKPLRHELLIDAVEEVLVRAPGWRQEDPLITRHTLEELHAQRSSHAVAPVTRALDDSPPLRVLLAEDNPVNQMVAVKMLERLHCRVDVVADGGEAVDMACRFAYDVIFMDVQMPRVDGHEATRRIRALASSASATRIVAMTANALTGDRERCLEAGMDDFIAKPVSPTALRDALARVAVSVAA